MDDLLRQLNLVRDEFIRSMDLNQKRALEQMDAVITSANNLMAEFSGLKTLADPNLMSAEVIKPPENLGGDHGSRDVQISIDHYTLNVINHLPEMPGKIVVLYYKKDKEDK